MNWPRRQGLREDVADALNDAIAVTTVAVALVETETDAVADALVEGLEEADALVATVFVFDSDNATAAMVQHRRSTKRMTLLTFARASRAFGRASVGPRVTGLLFQSC